MTHGFEVMLLALTVWGEARGESYKGKLGVAFVICNRAKFSGNKISGVVLKAWQFSFWNTDDPSRDDISDIDPNSEVWRECLKAAAAAYFDLAIDPTHGATFYMNVEAVIKQRGSLPNFWHIDTDPASEVVIDQHTFRRKRP